MTVIHSPLISLFGDPKVGKTAAALQCAPTAMCAGVPANLQLIWRNTLDLPPEELWLADPVPKTADDLLQLGYALEQMAPEDRPTELIVDDAGLNIASTFHDLDESDEAYATKSGAKNKFYAGLQMNPQIAEMSELFRHLGIMVIFLFHENKPKFGDSGKQKGGPRMPWRAHAEALEAWFDLNLRVYSDSDSFDPWFKRAFLCDADGNDWLTGDRSETCWKQTPGSLYEVLRAGGSTVRRYPGLEWQDEVADEVAALLREADVASPDDVKRVLAENGARWHMGRKPKHVRWAVQDGIARMLIEDRRNRDIFNFGG